eukprot:s3738_g5.t1
MELESQPPPGPRRDVKGIDVLRHPEAEFHEALRAARHHVDELQARLRQMEAQQDAFLTERRDAKAEAAGILELREVTFAPTACAPDEEASVTNEPAEAETSVITSKRFQGIQTKRLRLQLFKKQRTLLLADMATVDRKEIGSVPLKTVLRQFPIEQSEPSSSDGQLASASDSEDGCFPRKRLNQQIVEAAKVPKAEAGAKLLALAEELFFGFPFDRLVEVLTFLLLV